MNPQQHIIIIGFKHVGKSTIARLLAQKLDRPFFDSDEYLESLFHETYKKKYQCREIMQKYGADFFKNLETKALKKLMDTIPGVIALGGGTPMQVENQALIKPHIIVHLTAKPSTVFERVMKRGRPAFFPPDVDPQITFNRLWQEREKVYHQLTDICVQNDGKIESVVKNIRIALQDAGFTS